MLLLDIFQDDLFVLEAKKKKPCWKGYKQIGTKMKGGKEVPNCVPVEENQSGKED